MTNNYSKNIAAVGVMLVLMFIVIQIMNFYDVGQEYYYPFFIFYVMLLLCYIVLPNQDQYIKMI